MDLLVYNRIQKPTILCPETLTYKTILIMNLKEQEVAISNLCPDMTGELTSEPIFENASQMWAHSFSSLYSYTNAATNNEFALGISASDLQALLNAGDSRGNPCDGIRFYIALSQATTDMSQITNNLRIAMAPFNMIGESPVDHAFSGTTGPGALLTSSGLSTGQSIVTCTDEINFWWEHYDDDAAFLVPTLAYAFPRATIEAEIANAIAGDGYVQIIFGCHYINSDTQEYCIKNSRAYPSNKVGYTVMQLILGVWNTTTHQYDHSSDFVRPCPKMCGTALFPVL